jgi:hypothetical protein
MESVRKSAISELKTSIEISVMEEERLHAILDDDGVEGKEREKALEELSRALQNHRNQLEQLAAIVSPQ